MILAHQNAKGIWRVSQCRRHGRLFEMPVIDVAHKGDSARAMTEASTVMPCIDNSTAVLSERSDTDYTLAFQRLRATTGGASPQAVLKMLRTWQNQKVGAGQSAKRKLVTRKDTKLVRDAMDKARPRAKPLREVDTPAIQRLVGSTPKPLRFCEAIGGDHVGDRFPMSIDGDRYCHLWTEFSTNSIYVTTSATKKADTVLLALTQAGHHWKAPWDVTRVNICSNTTLYHVS